MIQIIKKYAAALIALICFSYANTAGAQSPVDNENQLKDALSNGGSYILTQSIVSGTWNNVPLNKSTSIDLNGKTLSSNYTGEDYLIIIDGNSRQRGSLTLKNGIIKIDGFSSMGLYTEGGNLILENGLTITGSDYPYITNVDGGTVTINGGTYKKSSSTTKNLFDNSSTININGGTFGYNVKMGGGRVNIKGGNFTESNINFGGATVKISGGTFGSDVSAYLEAGYKCTKVGSTWTVTKAGPAQIGTNYYETLAAAIAAANDGDEIKLLEDVTENVTVGGDQNITIDLNGKKITNAGADFTIVNNGTLILKNAGTIDAKEEHGILNNGTLTIKAATLTGEESFIKSLTESSVLNIEGGVYPQYFYTEGTTNISGGTFNSYLELGGTASISGGTFTDNITKMGTLSITGGTFKNSINIESSIADGYGMLDNGDGTYSVKPYVASIDAKKYFTIALAIADATEGATINLLSDVKESVTVPAGKNITLDLSTYTLTGADGVRTITNNGTLVVNNGTLTSVNQSIVENNGTLTLNVTATTATGAFPLITNNASAAVLNIADGSYTSTAASASHPVLNNGAGTMNISGGTFKTKASAAVANAGTINLTGGTYSSDVTSLLTKSYEAVNNGDGTWTVENAAVAKIGDVEYKSLSAAIAAATAGQTIKLVDNVEENVTIPAGKNITIDLDGKTLNGKQTTETCTILNEGTLTLKNGTVKRSGEGSASYYVIENRGTLNMNATVEGSADASLIRNNGAAAVMNITDGNYTQTGAFIVLKNDLGTCNVSGGTFTTADDKNVLNNWSQMNITGGTFNGNIFNGAYDTNNNVLSITGGTFNAGKIRTYIGNGQTLAPLNIDGGTFTNPSMVFVNTAGNEYTAGQEKPQVLITGGTYKTAKIEDYLVPGASIKNDGGTYSLAPVAMIGENEYPTLGLAVAAAQNGETIKLVADADIYEQVAVDGKNVTIDLNGKNITYKGGALNSGALMVYNGAGLTVNGEGNIDGGENAAAAIALTHKDHYDATKTAVLTVNGGNITGKKYAVVGNGTRNNTQITINGGNLKSGNAAIYQPQIGTLVINGGTLTGTNTAVEIRSGSLKITDGTLTATATEFSCDANGNGTTTVGAALAIEQHTTKNDIKVEITGGTFNGVKAVNESNPQENDPAPQVEMSITDGTFNGAVSVVDVENFISGGQYKYDLPAKYLAPGFATEANGDGSYSVKAKAVASIDTKLYASLAEAFAEATEGQTIKLLENVDLTETINVAKSVTLNMNGNNITAGNIRAIHVKEGTLTLSGSGKIFAKGTGETSSVIRVGDNEGTQAGLNLGADVIVESDNCYGITYFGKDKQNITISGTVKTVNASALSGNGSAGYGETTVNILSTAKITTTNDVAIYHPEMGKITIEGGEITGVTAVEMRSGEIEVKGGTLTATADAFSSTKNSNGTTSKGAALAIAQHDTKNPIKVTVSGGTFNGVRAFDESNPQGNSAEALDGIQLAITGGAFNGAVKSADVKNFISGGVYDEQFADDLCAVGFQLVPNGNGTFGVEPKDAVASIGTKLYYSLQAAVDAAQNGETIKLLANVNTDKQIEIAGKEVLLDLNDFTVKYTGTTLLKSGVIMVHNCAGLTVKNNGSIIGGDNAYGAIALTMAGDDASKPAKLTVNGGNITGKYYAVVGNGSRHNTEITINDGNLTSLEGAAIYHPQEGTLVVNGGTMTGAETAIEMRAGTLKVTGGTLIATAEEFKCESNPSGTTTIGAALAIEQHTTKKDIKVEITGGTFKGVKAINESNPQANDPAPQVDMTIGGGFFYGDITTADVDKFISGGTFDRPVPAELCAEHYEPMKRADGSYGVKIMDPVASIGSDFYFTLQEAVTAATAGQTVKLLADVTENIKVLSTQSLTLDLNGKTITEDAANNDQDCVISNAGKLTIKGNGTVKDAPSTKCKSLVLTTKEMVIENGTFVRDNFTGDYYYVVMADGSGAKLTIKDGTFEANNGGKRSRNVLGQNGATVVIDGGKYTLPTTSALTHVNVHSFNGANVTINGGEFSAPATGSKNLYAKRNATLTVNGGKFISADELSLLGTEETVNVTLYGGTYNNDVNEFFADYIPEKYECVESETQGWWIIREIPVPTKLMVYVGDHEPLILETSKEEMAEEWAKALTLYPNATAVVDKNFATWAKEQTNIIYPGEYGEYECQNLSLTDLSNEGYGTQTMAASTAFYAPVQEFKAVNMTYKRTLNNGWNSLALPFSFTPDACNTASEFYFTKVLVNPVLKDDMVEFDEQALTTQIEAGTPVLVHSTGGEVDFSSENVTIVTKAKNVNGMIGTFDFTDEYAGNYAPVSTADCLAPLANRLFPFRACINVPSTAKSLRFTYNNISGIHDIIFNEAEANDIFNVSGMKVNNANKSGLYIINGKKVMKK